MSKVKAIYVPLIALLPWIIYPVAWYFLAIKPTREEWDKQFQARNASRGAYGSAVEFRGNWPREGDAKLSKREEEGKADQEQDLQAFNDTKGQKEKELAAKIVERDQHKVLLDATINRYMRGINRSRFNYEKPDEFLYELLKTQRDEAGPRLIRFLHRTYPRLYFGIDATVPAPPINITAASLPPTGPQGRLPWPLGKESFPLTIYGLYGDLLSFVETFPERYDRVCHLTDFSLNREAFDYRGVVLMRLNVTAHFFVWPDGIKPPPPPPAPDAGGAPGAPGEGGEAPPAEDAGGGGGGGDGGGGGGGEE